MPFGLSGSSAKLNVSVEPAYQIPRCHLGVEMVVPEQDEVGLKARQVDLDLVYVGVPGLHLLDAGMSNEQVGLVCAPRLVGLLEGLQSGIDAQHLGDGVDDKCPVVCTDLEALVGQAVGKVHLGERVSQGAVRAPPSREPRGVVVAADRHAGHPVVANGRQRSLGYPERAVVRRRVVEDVAEPDEHVRLLLESQVYRRLERPLEVPLALVYAPLDGVRQVGAAEVGVSDGSNLHETSTARLRDGYGDLGSAAPSLPISPFRDDRAGTVRRDRPEPLITVTGG